MFGKPEWRLVPASRVPEREQAAGKLVVRQDRLHFGLKGPVIGIEDGGTECSAAVAADHSVGALFPRIAPGPAHMIRREHRHTRGAALVRAGPNLDAVTPGEEWW